MATKRYVTENSVYEVNKSAKVIRRVEGISPPTEAFTPDGEWKPYEFIQEQGGFIYPDRVTVWWGSCRYTVLSSLREVGEA